MSAAGVGGGSGSGSGGGPVIPVLHLQHPYRYASSKPPLLSQPQHLTSFSYGEDRELLLDREHRDASLKWYRQPMLGLDLRFAYERCRWRSEDLVEGIDGLIDCLQGSLNDDRNSSAMFDLLRRTAVVSWRGMLTKIMTSIYESHEGWEMNAMMLNGTLYLEEHKPHMTNLTQQQKSKPEDPKQKLMTYFGYSFESYCTTNEPSAPQPTNAAQYWSGDVNTNVQWGSVVRTTLGDIPMLLGGEVDCVQDNAGLERPLQTTDFIELKTNVVIESEKDEIRFERYKLLKHYVQSLLLGVPSIVIGFRQQNGILAGIQSFETLDIPNLVAGKPHAWHASSCLASGHAILSFILDTVNASHEVRAFDEAPETNPAPVFRLSYRPSSSSSTGQASLSVRSLSQAEIRQVQAGKTRMEERVGFLPSKWVKQVQTMNTRRPQTTFELNY